MRIKVERLLRNGNVELNLDSGAICDNNSQNVISLHPDQWPLLAQF